MIENSNLNLPSHLDAIEKLFFGFLYPDIENKVFTSSEEIDQIFQEAKQRILGMNVPLSDQTWEIFVEQARRRLSLSFDYGSTISDGESEPWTASCFEIKERYYWNRYKNYLKNKKGWATKVINSIDHVTEDVLDLCGNPDDVIKPWQKRGLVIGDVQSGKTAVFTGLINKAADAGYQVFIVLTGTLETLRQQTQERLEKEFVGLSSNINKNNAPIGVGIEDPEHKAFCCTSVHSDFKIQSKMNMNFELSSVSDPILLVIKKNKRVLQTVKDWLRKNNLRNAQYIDKTLFLIDDEADNASINTNKIEDENPTAINKEIRELLALFKNATYVGFTATPFANVFINPEHIDGKPDDLFPRNFIRTTDIPNNYFGTEKLLGGSEEDDEVVSPYICQIEDAENMLPQKHKSDFIISDLCNSLKTAVKQFFLTNAIMDVRNLNQKHRTMMVNISRFTKVQNQAADLIQNYVENYISQIQVHGNSRFAASNPYIQSLKDCFSEYFSESGCTWTEIQNSLFESVKNIRVYTANITTKESAALNYDNHPNGLRAIVVGGQAIARGITLEGLCISYFYRSTAYYDTLMQMGRWFGYRPGYEDICKIWLTDQTADYYRQIYRATEELKDEIAEMQRAKLTPKVFGLRVRESPDSLLITSRNKMRISHSFEIRTLFSSYFTESTKIPIEKQEDNLEAVKQLIKKIKSLNILESFGLKQRVLFRDVPKELIADFMDHFSVDPSCYMLSSYADDSEHGLANFIRNNSVKKLQTWDVVIEESKRNADNTQNKIDLGLTHQINPIKRRTGDKKEWDKGKLIFYKSRIAGSDIEAEPLSENEYNELCAKFPPIKKGEPRTHIGIRQACRHYRQKPLLILMPTVIYDENTDLKNKENPSDRLSDKVFMAYGLSFCHFAEPGSPNEVKVLYKVNSTWFKEHLADDDEGEDSEDD